MYNTKRLLRRACTVMAAGAVLTLMSAAPAAAQDGEYQGTFGQLNNSGLSGQVTVSLSGTSADVTVTVDGVADLVHAQHIHGEYDVDNTCPTETLDSDGDALISTVEGVSAYGTVKASLVTSGPTDESYALAIEAFPVASGGSYEYTRTIEVPQELADNLDNMIVVVHGVDLDSSGEYDGDAPSSLDENLPLEATIPAGCATLVAAGATPTGAVAAGGGGTDAAGSTGAGSTGAAVAAAVGALLLVGARRRSRA